MPNTRDSRRAELIVLGEFFLDLIFWDVRETPRFGIEVRAQEFSEMPGGGLGTTALVAARLGTRTSAVTRVGGDAPAHKSWRELERAGVDTSASEIRSDLSTAITACVAHNRDRMLVTWDPINHNLERLLDRDAVRAALGGARHLHLTCALRDPRRWRRLLRPWRARGLTVSADLGWTPDLFRLPELRELFREFDFLFPNEIEARALAHESDPARAALVLARSVKQPVVKFGRRGSLTVVEGRLMRAPALPVEVVDATGAGDAFDAGFLHAYLRGWDAMDCLRAGNVCGALATTGPGGSADAPDERRLRRLMRRLRSEERK